MDRIFLFNHRYRNLKKLGFSEWTVLLLVNTCSKGYGHIAGAPLNSVLFKGYWNNPGLMSLLNRYYEICST